VEYPEEVEKELSTTVLATDPGKVMEEHPVERGQNNSTQEV